MHVTIARRCFSQVLSLACFLALFSVLAGSSEAKPKPDAAAKAKPLKAAVATGYFPMLYTDAQGKLDGFDVHYAKALSRKLGRPIELVVVPFDKLLDEVRAGRADLGMAAIELYPDASALPYVEYFRMPQALIAKVQNPLKPALEPDMSKAIIGTLTIADARGVLHELAEKGRVGKSRGYEGEPALIDALERGMIDGAVLNLPTALQLVAKSDGKWRIIAPSVARQGLGIAVDPAQPRLLEEITAAARDLQKSGETGRIEASTFELTYRQASVTGAGG